MKLGSDPLPTLPYDNKWREHAESEGSASSSAGNEETGNIRSPKCSMILWMGSGRGRQNYLYFVLFWLAPYDLWDLSSLHWKCGVNPCTTREVAGRHSFNHTLGFITLLILLQSPWLLITISSYFQNCADHVDTCLQFTPMIFLCVGSPRTVWATWRQEPCLLHLFPGT